MVLLTVTLLGGFEARLASGMPLRLPKKAQALVGYLAARSGQGEPRDKLAALLWGEKNDAQARDGLRHVLSALRRALGRAPSRILRVEGQTLALDPERIEVDVTAFERLVAEKSTPALEQAAALYRGDLLAGLNLNEPLFEEWLVSERERLRELAVDGLIRLLADQTQAMTAEPAIQTAVRLLGLDPLQESVHRTLMQLYARQGRRGAALKQYQLCVGALRRELGTEPEAETKRLYQHLLRGPTDAPSAETGARARTSSGPGVPSAPEMPAAETPLFGRQAELERLRARLHDAIGGRGQIVTVVGEAGIGKTRLIGALAAAAEDLGCQIMIGRCHESDSILPFGPWVDACRTRAVAGDEAILGALHPTRRSELARLLPEAGHAGLPPASDSALLLFESVAVLVEQLAGRRPLVLLFEDLHWADEMSLRLLAFIGRRVPQWPTLLVATAREEELPDAATARRTLEELSRQPAATPIVLAPLSRADTARLIRALGRVASGVSPQVEAHVWNMSEGNPFVTVEAMRAMEQPGASDDAPSGRRAPPLPPTVRDLVARRLDRLSARGQQLAAVAAVIGRPFDFPLLRSASGVDEEEAAEALEEIVRYRLVQAVGPQLDFTHDRIREVAYERLIAARRELLHRAVAAALAGQDIEGHIEQLAYHALRGELGETAARYLRLAGAKAAGRSALQDARAWLDQALSVLENLPPTRSVLEEGFDARVALWIVLSQLCEFRLALEELRAAETLAERLDDESRLCRVRAFMANIHSRLGEPDEALALARQALQIAERLGDLRLCRLSTTFIAQAHQMRGEFASAAEIALHNVTAVPAEGTHDVIGGRIPVAVTDHGWLVQSLAHLGRFAEAAPHEANMIRIAEATGHPHTMAYAYTCASTLHIVRGDWKAALTRLEQLLAVLRTSHIVDQLAHALAHSARVLTYFGELEEARRRIREAEQLLDDRVEGGGVGNPGWLHQTLGRAYLVLGQIDEARRHGERAVAMSSGRTDSLPNALNLLGYVASLRDGNAGEAEALYRRALALAEARGMRPLVAHCHFGLGRLHQGAGSARQAHEHLTTATALYRELGMDDGRQDAQTVSNPKLK